MLKNVMIAIATLLLVGGGLAGGYMFGQRSNTAEAPASTHDGDVPNFPSLMSVGDTLGTDCIVDFNAGSSACTYGDGTRQTVSRDDDNRLQIRTFSNDDDEEGECVTLPVLQMNEQQDDGSSDSLSTSDSASFIRPGAQTKRIKSWVIKVPSALNELAEDGVGIDELEYFEKDGEAWRAEFFEHGKDEPTTVQLGVGTEQVVKSDASPGTCTDLAEQLHGGRSLNAAADFFGPVGAGVGMSAYMGFFCAAGPYTCAGAGIVALGGLILASMTCNDGCRRRRLAAITAPPKMLRIAGGHVPAPRALFRIDGSDFIATVAATAAITSVAGAAAAVVATPAAALGMN